MVPDGQWIVLIGHELHSRPIVQFEHLAWAGHGELEFWRGARSYVELVCLRIALGSECVSNGMGLVGRNPDTLLLSDQGRAKEIGKLPGHDRVRVISQGVCDKDRRFVHVTVAAGAADPRRHHKPQTLDGPEADPESLARETMTAPGLIAVKCQPEVNFAVVPHGRPGHGYLVTRLDFHRFS